MDKCLPKISQFSTDAMPLTINKKLLLFITLLINLCQILPSYSFTMLKQLQIAYPKHVYQITSRYIVWQDGTRMPIQNISLFDKLFAIFHQIDSSQEMITKKDIVHGRFEPFFKKMYGQSAKEVKKNLVLIY